MCLNQQMHPPKKKKKQNLNNKPGNFTTRIIPEIILDDYIKYHLVLDHLSMTASWHNIRPEYDNNRLKISKKQRFIMENNNISKWGLLLWKYKQFHSQPNR